MADIDEKKGIEKEPESEEINLKIVGSDYIIFEFKIKKHTTLRKLLKDYCVRTGITRENVRFLFDNLRVNDYDTPISLELEDGDIIDVYQEQEGGAYL